MATYGVTAQGFYAKPMSQIAAEIDAALQGILGASAGSNSDGTIPLESMAGQLKSLIVDGLAATWDLQEAVYSSMDPNQATGASQDALGAITGIIRDASELSTVTANCTGVPATVIQAGSVATVAGTTSRFDTLATATIATAATWTGTNGYVPGSRVTNVGNIYNCTIGGTSASSGGPTGTSSSISDGSVTWQYVGVGTGYVDIPCISESTGPIAALAGTLSSISTPIQGWKNVTNLVAAVVGSFQETDSAFRLRRDQELSAAGNTTADAIRANILAVNQGSTDPNHAPPTSCVVFFNDTDFTNVNGLPPHSVEVMAYGGTAADIALAVWNSVGAGTATHGGLASTITDSSGNTQIVNWTIPTPINIYVTATVYYNAAAWPPGTTSALVVQYIQSAILTYTNQPVVGQQVRVSPLLAAIMLGPAAVGLGLDGNIDAVVPAPAGSLAVPGLLEVPLLNIGTAPSPMFNTTIAITARQVAIFSANNLSISVVTEAP